MASEVFNIAKGRGAELANRVNANDPANAALVVVLLKATASDAVLRDLDTLAAVIADAAVDEADFTNYARIILDQADGITVTVDDTNDRVDVQIPDQVWAAAGGAANNTLVKVLVCYDPDTTAGTDADIVPILHMDVSGTTNGNPLNLDITTAYILRAS